MSKISQTQKECLDYIKANGGIIYRYPGGFWGNANWQLGNKHFGTSTIHSLVIKGLLFYSEYKKSRYGNIDFPIEAQIMSAIRQVEG